MSAVWGTHADRSIQMLDFILIAAAIWFIVGLLPVLGFLVVDRDLPRRLTPGDWITLVLWGPVMIGLLVIGSCAYGWRLARPEPNPAKRSS